MRNFPLCVKNGCDANTLARLWDFPCNVSIKLIAKRVGLITSERVWISLCLCVIYIVVHGLMFDVVKKMQLQQKCNILFLFLYQFYSASTVNI